MRTHRWVRAGTSGPPVSDPQDAFPWLVARVFEGSGARGPRPGSTSCRPRPHATARPSREMVSSPARSRRWWWRIASSACSCSPRSPASSAGRRTSSLASGWSARSSPAPLPAGTPSSPSGRPCRRTSASASAWRPRTSTCTAELVEARDFGEIVGRSPALQAVVEKVRQVADTTAPVLLLGRDRHRQGAARPRDPRARPAARPALHRRQLRRPARHAHRERALRPREGRLHRRDPGEARSVRARRPRDAPPRRDRRARARPPDEAPPRPRGRRDPAARVDGDAQGRRPDHRGHEPRPAPGHARRAGSGRISTTG